MKTTYSIGWFDNKWDYINEIKIPISDRGLMLGDGIFETIFVENKIAYLLEDHMQRWHDSAKSLFMESPPDKIFILKLISEGIDKLSLGNGACAARLNWSRGDMLERSISIKKENPNKCRFWMTMSKIKPNFEPVSAKISNIEYKNTNSRLNLFKTFNYIQSIIVKHEAQLQGYDEAILKNQHDNLVCASTANIIINRDDEFITPNLQSGCMPGLMRNKGIKKGLFKEKEIGISPRKDDIWLLINSLGCQPIYRIDNLILNKFNETEKLWRALLN